jgi:hypothetical protein
VLLLPPAPIGSHLAQIRSRLAGQMADSHSTLSDPPAHLTKLEDFALTIGMPKGSSSESKVLLALGGRQPHDTKPPSMKWADGENTCDCAFCDCASCRSNQHGGASKCILRTTADLDHLSRGKKDVR